MQVARIFPVLLLCARAAADPAPSRWVYRLEVKEGELDAKPRKLEIVLVETGRRTLASRQVVDLGLEVKGKRVAADELESLGLASAPFATFATTWSLVFGGGKVALTGGREPLSEKSIKDELRSATTWRLKDQKLKRPKHEPDDRPFRYGRKIGAWPSICEGYVHPSPDTGDYYESERCFAPGVGITRLAFDSVWGGFEAELAEAPPAPALPVP